MAATVWRDEGPNLRSTERDKGRVYEARYYDEAGRRRGKTFRRKTDARRFLRDVEADVQRGEWLDPEKAKTPFRNVAEMWQDTWVDLKPSTMARYESILSVHLLPEFGVTPVGRISHARVQRYVSDLQRQGVSDGTTRKVYAVLNTCLNTAVRYELIKANPCEGVRLPSPNEREMLFLTAEQVADLADAINEPYGVLIYFAAYTGLRAGEYAGLRVKSLDLLRGTLQVVESLTDVDGELVPVTPKTDSSKRSVKLPRFLCEMLAKYLADRDHGPDDLVFTAPRGAPLRQGNFRKRQFRDAVKAALPEHLKKLRPHDLRHTCASLLIAQGAHPKAIQERLGHSSITITLDRYGHLLPSLDDQLADGLDATYRAAMGQRGDADVLDLPTGTGTP